MEATNCEGSSQHNKIFTSFRIAGAAIFLTLAVSGCEKKPPPPKVTTKAEPSAIVDTSRINRAALTLWEAGENALAVAADSALNFNTTIDILLDAPTPQNLKLAQSAWEEVFEAYRQFYFFYYLGQSLPEAFEELSTLHFRIAANPIQPGYLDTFGPYPYSGLVHDIGMELSKENISSQHGLTNTEDATLGLHVLHFMLFGENGNRSADDYKHKNKLTAGERERGFNDPAETPNNRRRLLLRLQSDLLVEDVRKLTYSWKSNDLESLKAIWSALEPELKLEAVRRTLLQGLTQLIVDVVELKKMDDAKLAASEPTQTDAANPDADETEDTEETDIFSSEEDEGNYSIYVAKDQKQFILLATKSLLAAVPVLSETRAKKIETALNNINLLLTDKEPATGADLWSDVYQNLKIAVDSLSAT